MLPQVGLYVEFLLGIEYFGESRETEVQSPNMYVVFWKEVAYACQHSDNNSQKQQYPPTFHFEFVNSLIR